MKSKDLEIISQALAPAVGEYVAQKIAPLLLRVHGLETRCEQMASRIRGLESGKSVTAPSTPKTLPVVKLKDRLPVIRLGTASRRVVRL
jgi:hypothetical protein